MSNGDGAFIGGDQTRVAPGISELLYEYSSILAAKHTTESVKQRIVDLTRRAIPTCEAAGLMYVKDKSVIGGPASSQMARSADMIQLESDLGPCLHAIREGVVVTIEDLADAPIFPEVCGQMAITTGARNSLSLPLKAEDQTLGALNLYSLTPSSFTEEDQAVGKLLAVPAAIALANVAAYEDAKELTAQLEAALESRAVIDQAKGILIATERITPEQAFDRLRKASQHANIPVREIAKRMVEKFIEGG